MIAPTAFLRKGTFVNTSRAERIGRIPPPSRVTGSLGESYCCPTSANRLPCPFGIYDSALTRSFRFRIPQPPAPRGRRDRACSQRELIPILGQRKLVLFRLRARLHAAALSAPKPACRNQLPFRKFEAELAQLGHGRAEHRTRLVAIAILNIDDRGVDAIARNALKGNGPASRTAVPVADLH